MISRVFVANRGEIALRVVRACRARGVEAVLGASEVDLEGPAARLADRVVCLGPAPASASYLLSGTVVEAALGTGCDAIHPGYGFLAENAGFAALAAEHGLRFVGPPAAVIELTGDKLRARAAAAEAGLPLVPGRAVGSHAEAAELAREIGYPILLKAAGGGGGRGIKLARDDGELAALFDLAAAEARSAFGDARLYAERFITAARHVEVQVLGDDRGHVVHLGERDCSTQRRYQKVIEEAPAFARAIGYSNAGTVELAIDVEREDFAFLEMNCRIQVEHPVTEAVTGVDLVDAQLAIAGGEPLPFAQPDLVASGHAIECRLTAEDPDDGFRPCPGRVGEFSMPELPGLRVDTNCEDGTVIPPHYDSLIAKLIAHGPDREAARTLLLEALDRLTVTGVRTNRELLARLLREPRFVEADVTTRWLEETLA